MTNLQNVTMEVLTAPIQKQWLNPREVFNEYGFSISTLAKWRMSNLYIPYSKMGKYIKYQRADIEAFIKSNIVEVA